MVDLHSSNPHRGKKTFTQMDFASDHRYCPSSQLMRAMHGTLLLHPVLGLAREHEELCVPVNESEGAENWELLQDELDAEDRERNMRVQEEDMIAGSKMYTWKARESRSVRAICAKKNLGVKKKLSSF